MGGGERKAEVAGGENDCSRGCFGCHALWCGNLDKSLAECPDNSPTAEVGSGSDRERAGELDPERHVRVGGDGSVGY